DIFFVVFNMLPNTSRALPQGYTLRDFLPENHDSKEPGGGVSDLGDVGKLFNRLNSVRSLPRSGGKPMSGGVPPGHALWHRSAKQDKSPCAFVRFVLRVNPSPPRGQGLVC